MEEFALVRPRATRLAAVSFVALPAVAYLAAIASSIPRAAVALLVAGWILMPPILLAIARRPGLRRLTAVPSTVVWSGVAVATYETGIDPGWLMILLGLTVGAILGAWLWLGWLPAPAHLRLPTHPVRLSLIAGHVGLIAAGAGRVAFG